MKKFSFPLEKLRAWREMQFKAEESKLQALLSEQASLAALQMSLEAERRRADDALARPSINSEELLAADRFGAFATRQQERLASASRDLDGRIALQRGNLLEARKKVEVLDHLKEKRLAQWRAELDKEQENMVAELVVARWKAAGSGL
jgi:flagellar export protein FliJ